MLLLFVDDSLLLLPNSKEEVINIHVILLMFEAISGLKFNLPKSKMMVVGKVPNLHKLIELLGYSLTSAPGIYLRLSLRGGLKSKHN